MITIAKLRFDKKKLCAFKNECLILQENRSTPGDGLWDIPILKKTKTPSLKPTTVTQDPEMNVI